MGMAAVESFLTRPICLVLLLASLLSFCFPLIKKFMADKKAAAN